MKSPGRPPHVNGAACRTEEDLATWRRGLAQVDGVDWVMIPDSNHLFIPGDGEPGPAEYMNPGHVDARVVERRCAFLLSARECSAPDE